MDNIEQLKEYRKKLSMLSEEEKKLRDLYLKKLSEGSLQGPMTGFPSLDKTWLKYYDDNIIMETTPKKTVFEYLYENNKENLNDVAIEYYGKKITYEVLFKNIEKATQAYKSLGVKKGDIVTLCTITTPEIIYSFYALNRLGAIANMVDVRYTQQAIENYLKEVKSKYFVTLDICYPKIKNIINNTAVEKVITISPINSIPTLARTISKLSNQLKKTKVEIPTDGKYINWNEFIDTRIVEEIKSVSYIKDYPAAIVHTGGTTGTPKGVLLTNDNFNNATVQIKSVINQRKYKFLNIMPPFIAYGLVLGLNAPITLGWDTTVVPQFDPNKFDELLLKYRPNGIMGVPTYWETVMKSKKIANRDLSFIKNILLGGDRIKPEFEIRLNEFLRNHNVSSEVSKGYSMTEVSAMSTFSSSKANELDSVGAPLAKTNMAIFEPGTTRELRANEIGEIGIQTPTMMKEYYERQLDTDMIKVKHDDGYWIHSGDIGYINENGIVFVKDRIKRMIPRSGFKVFPSEIENLFMKNEAVEACAVVAVPDEVDVSAPKAHVVLNKIYRGKEKIVEKDLIEMFQNSDLPPYFKPVAIEFRDSLPVTDIGKIDFISLQNEDKVLIKKK